VKSQAFFIKPADYPEYFLIDRSKKIQDWYWEKTAFCLRQPV